ncbi:hypothetical protein NHX12_032118 [Muraenolepis orangiensis]|uniref:Uncharacterized protein n=1 Tax=Muraenolepis orangiensis TaxID=630683 RepID=A0A9Q0E944_9TELE|nr:hypothetical protein NHX12_032118 [Muraenolepis orangiensis]
MSWIYKPAPSKETGDKRYALNTERELSAVSGRAREEEDGEGGHEDAERQMASEEDGEEDRCVVSGMGE